jgi:hypothetical protein
MKGLDEIVAENKKAVARLVGRGYVRQAQYISVDYANPRTGARVTVLERVPEKPSVQSPRCVEL